MRLTTLDLPGVFRMEEASNKAIEKLQRSNAPIRATLTVLDEGVLFQPGDVVQVTSSNRGVDFPMWVEQSVMVSYGRHQITGVIYADEQFSDLAYCDADEIGKLSDTNGWVKENTSVYGCYCDALDKYWYLNAVTGSLGQLYWPCVGQTTRNGGMWSYDYLINGGWNASPKPDGTLNLTVPTLPEQDNVNQTAPGTTRPVFCGTGGITQKQKYNRVLWPSEYQTAIGSGWGSVSCMYYQTRTSPSSLGCLTLISRISWGDSTIQTQASSINGNPAIAVTTQSQTGDFFELPTDRMVAITLAGVYGNAPGGEVTVDARLYVDGVLVSSVDYTNPFTTTDTFLYWKGVGMESGCYVAHLGVTGSNNSTQFYTQSELICRSS